MARGDQDRDLGEIIKFGTKFDEFCDNVKKISRQLASDASSAESVLQDEISQKNIQTIYSLCLQLNSAVDQPAELVRELVLKARREQSDLEELRGMSR